MCVHQLMIWYQNISLPNIGIIPKNGALIGLQFWQISPSSEIAAPAIWTHSDTLQSQYHCDKLCSPFCLTSPPQRDELPPSRIRLHPVICRFLVWETFRRAVRLHWDTVWFRPSAALLHWHRNDVIWGVTWKDLPRDPSNTSVIQSN